MQKSAWLVFLSIVALFLYARPQEPGVERLFANPPMLYSRDGQLHVDLVAAPNTYTIDGHQFQGMLYNGSYMPPVWRVRLGDTLTVTLHNQPSEDTNLHFHGLDVSPLKNGDNVFLHIPPGETFKYQIKIRFPRNMSDSFGFIPTCMAMWTAKSLVGCLAASSSKAVTVFILS